ncbi:MAG TPA: universal stress protein [Methylomirabilota bacterium]|nr:universal stress protein [Methylomirabilota bacterium]
MYKRVIVPLDGSPLAEGILPFILAIAGPLDMDIVLLRVVTPIPPSVIEGSRHVALEDMEGRVADARAYLATVAADLTTRGLRTSVAVRRGEPVVEILAGARDEGADLIAMTTHGRSGLGRVLFGSVAQAVVQHSEVPVFLMKLTKDQMQARAAHGAPR